MSITTLVLIIVISLWSSLGVFFYFITGHLVNRAWSKRKYFRCILFSLICGPISFIIQMSFIMWTLAKVLTSFLLQELPDERK